MLSRERADGRDGASRGSDGTGDHYRFSTDLPFFASQLDTTKGDVADLVRETMLAQPNPVCAEGVGFDDVGAGVDVGPVDGRDNIRVGEVERIEALVQGPARLVQHRAHRAIEEKWSLEKLSGKRMCHRYTPVERAQFGGRNEIVKDGSLGNGYVVTGTV